MELKIDKAGRIVVSKRLRERLGFKPDTDLEAREQPDGVLIRRVKPRPAMIKVDGLSVHHGKPEPGADWKGSSIAYAKNVPAPRRKPNPA